MEEKGFPQEKDIHYAPAVVPELVQNPSMPSMVAK